MGLTERHWFEDEEPELTEQQLEDIIYENKKAYDNGYAKGFRDASVFLKKNRPEGKWIEEKPNSCTTKTYCSVCKEPAPFIAVGGDYYGRNMHGKTEKTKYCPNCGAIMTQ